MTRVGRGDGSHDLEERAEEIAAAAQGLGQEELARLVFEHLIAVQIETAARVMRRSMASERPAARAN